jgi:hypothetical protein
MQIELRIKSNKRYITLQHLLHYDNIISQCANKKSPTKIYTQYLHYFIKNGANKKLIAFYQNVRFCPA